MSFLKTLRASMALLLACMALTHYVHARTLPIQATLHADESNIRNTTKNTSPIVSGAGGNTSLTASFSAPSKDCTSVFKGGASEPIQQGLKMGLSVMGLLPGLGDMAKWMGSLVGFLFPSSDPEISARSVYDCISGFVEEAIDRKIDEFDLRTNINSKVQNIARLMKELRTKIAQASNPITLDQQIMVGLAFDRIEDKTDDLGSYFFDSVAGVRDPAGALPVFATFISTQFLPILALKYNHFNEIYGTANVSSSTLQQIAEKSEQVLNSSNAFYNRASSDILGKRVQKVGQPEFWSHDGCIGPIAQPNCAQWGYKFKDDTTGYEFNARKSGFDIEEGGETQRLINDMRSLVINRAESSSRINTYMATASRPSWPLLIAGGSGKVLARRVTVEKNLCFSNNVRAEGPAAHMPEGHNYQDYNISEIVLRTGDWLDYIKVVYTHRYTGKNLIQEFGNPNGGASPTSPRDLLNNPITRTTWSSRKLSDTSDVVSSLMGVRFIQAKGEETAFGTMEYGQWYTDDFSIWNGRVWLCGMDIHGELGSRVWGIGPHWCYNEEYTVTAPPSPPPQPPSPPTCSFRDDWSSCTGSNSCCTPRGICGSWQREGPLKICM